MKPATILATLFVTLAPAVALAEGCPYSTSAMSCVDGQVYDAETRACVPVTG